MALFRLLRHSIHHFSHHVSGVRNHSGHYVHQRFGENYTEHGTDFDAYRRIREGDISQRNFLSNHKNLILYTYIPIFFLTRLLI